MRWGGAVTGHCNLARPRSGLLSVTSVLDLNPIADIGTVVDPAGLADIGTLLSTSTIPDLGEILRSLIP
jgi:hypothetical protein